jgi:hypothetical protein
MKLALFTLEGTLSAGRVTPHAAGGRPCQAQIASAAGVFQASWSAVPGRGILGFVFDRLIYVPYIAALEARERHMRVRQRNDGEVSISALHARRLIVWNREHGAALPTRMGVYVRNLTPDHDRRKCPTNSAS